MAIIGNRSSDFQSWRVLRSSIINELLYRESIWGAAPILYIVSHFTRITLYLPYIMSSNPPMSLLEVMLDCFGQRISGILLRSGDKDKNYIASLHNEVVSITAITY